MRILTISASRSKNGKIFINSESLGSVNQLSMGIPFSSWYLKQRIVSNIHTVRLNFTSNSKLTQMLAENCQWWSSWTDLSLVWSSLWYSCHWLVHSALEIDDIWNDGRKLDQLKHFLGYQTKALLDQSSLGIQQVKQLIRIDPLGGSKQNDFKYLRNLLEKLAEEWSRPHENRVFTLLK